MEELFLYNLVFKSLSFITPSKFIKYLVLRLFLRNHNYLVSTTVHTYDLMVQMFCLVLMLYSNLSDRSITFKWAEVTFDKTL